MAQQPTSPSPQRAAGAHEVVAEAQEEQLRESERISERSQEHGEHVFGPLLGEVHEREHRRKVVSTVILALVFVALLATYAYLHGSTRFELFQPTPTSSTVQPIPIIPWEEYQKQHQQQPSPQSSSLPTTTSSSTSTTELTTETVPEETTTEDTERRRLFPPFGRTGEDETSSSVTTSELPE